ncbi:MAG: SDR family NAD(P)-dependent oxidoreductase [bacterium]
MPDLQGKTVLITGATAGIGQACAGAFAEAGARLVLLARRKERLDEMLRQLGGDVHVSAVDLRQRDQVFAAIEGLPETHRTIDILINNAGLGRGLDKLHQGDVDGWEEMIDTNIKGLLYVSRAVLPGMVERGRGQVINIGSIAGHEVYPGGNVYCATKHAVDALTKGMRIDLVDTPIRVATIDPGLVQTEFSEVRFHGDTERAKKVYQGYTPLIGKDIAEAAIWIATRPEHVQIAEIIIFPTAQASAAIVHKES